ncbi:MAG TPA: GlxA family transcriptional regulator [Paucimonas sp.]|nr:GlxA family transcriptional regulator [Paucimonas sp.]
MHSHDDTPSGSSGPSRSRRAARKIAVFAFEGVELLDVVGPLETFANASALMSGSSRPYLVDIVAERRGPIRSSSGLSIEATAELATLADADTLLIAGGGAIEAACARANVVDAITKLAPTVRRIGSVCTGAFLLARAGLLDGRRAVTHWNWCERLARAHPEVRVEKDPIFICDGDVWTSAGVTAGIDLALAMIEEDHGPELALRVARELVMFRKRPGGQSQFSVELAAQSVRNDKIRQAQQIILDNPASDLSVDALAAKVAMSPRNFARVFKRETGASPAEFTEQVRLASARACLETTAVSIEEVSGRCGFRSADVMRRVFLRHLDVTPTDYRERFGMRRPASRPDFSTLEQE